MIETDVRIDCSLAVPVECTFRVTEEQIEVMVRHGASVEDEELGEYYRRFAGQTVDGVKFLSLAEIAEYEWHTKHTNDIIVEQWDSWGDPPDRFWPPENDDD